MVVIVGGRYVVGRLFCSRNDYLFQILFRFVCLMVAAVEKSLLES